MPGRNEVTSRPGVPALGVRSLHVQHLGHRQQPPHQPEHRRVDLGRLRAAGRAPDAVHPDHGALPRRLREERLAAEAALQRAQAEGVREVHGGDAATRGLG